MGCGSHMGGHMFSHGPDNKGSDNNSSLGLIMILPFLIGLVIFCGIVVYKIGLG